MIKTLRKRHLQIWILWAALLPMGVIVAWMSVPKKITQELLPKEIQRSNDDTIASVDKGNYAINILLDRSKAKKIPLLRPLYSEKGKPVHMPSLMDSLKNEFRLEFVNKKELTTPSLLLYQITDSTTTDLEKQELLGRIEGKGSQYFHLELPQNLFLGFEFTTPGERAYKAKFILYDIIKNHTIDSVIFKTPL